jgi:hypothetical protein
MRALGGKQGGGRLSVVPTWTDGSSSEDNGNLSFNRSAMA